MSRLRHRERRTRIRKESRTRPVRGHKDYGEGQDDGKYFRCWNCGFVCDVDRDELGGPDSKSRVTTKSYTYEDQYGNGPSTASPDYTIFMEDTTRYEPVVSSGCPLCGSINWRGDYP